MGSSFGGTIKLSGESEYKQALASITANLKVLGSELKIITSQYDKNDKSTQNLTQQNEILTRKIEEQKNKVDILKNALESAKKETGENSNTTKKWQVELNNAQAELNKLEKELNDNNDEIEKFEKSLQENVEELDKEEESLEDNNNELDKFEKNLEENVNELDKSEQSLESNNDELKNMANNFDDAGSSGLKFGDIIKANIISEVIISGIKKLGSTVVEVGKSFIDVGKQAFESYASYEQLVGGVDTLFGESSGKVQKYAAAAYETAGMTANEYMESVTSFSASLLQSLKGDTDKAAESANQALIDMSDNANKMRNRYD